MFGYRFRLIKNKEQHELDIFKNSVVEIERQCTSLINYLNAGNFYLDDILCSNITLRVDSIKSLVDIYSNNLYSLPSITLSISNTFDKITEDVTDILETILDLYSEDSQHDQPFNQSKVAGLFHSIMQHTHLIKLYINHDLTRINMGVDIYADYKKRKKMFEKYNKPQTVMNIQYILASKSDILFNEKEKKK